MTTTTAKRPDAKVVSCRFFETLLRDLRERGQDPARLVAGTTCTLATLADKDERIDWPTFLALMANGRQFWTDADLVRLGERSTDSPFVRFIGVVARLRFSVPEFYQWVAGPKGMASQMFSCLETSCAIDGPNQVTIELRMLPGLAPSRELWLVSEGTYAAMPTMLGAPPAATSATYGATSVRYRVVFREPAGLLARGRRALLWPFTMRQAAEELTNAHATLLERYHQLDRARAELARESRKQRVANHIANLALGTLAPEATMGAVCAAMIEQVGCVAAEIQLDRGAVVRHDVGEASSARRRFALTSGALALGHLEVTLPPAADDQLALVESVVPTIALVVQKALDQQALTEYRQRLEQRVADRTAELTRARDELAATVTRLEETKASRERLFHNISHEIRTPLSLVLLLVDGVLTHHGGELTGRAVAQMHAITISTRKLVRLVDELLLLASGEERDLQVTPEPIDLAAVLPELLAGWVLAAEDAGLTLTTICPPEAVVLADPVALERVLANLLSNAIKFTPRGGQVAVAVEAGPTTTRIAVRDSGIGIDDELRGRLFGRFEQGAGGKRLRAGSGIGLSIARELVRAHGGELDAAANRDGPGSTFAFTLATSSVELARQVAPGSLRPTDYGVGAGPSLGTVSPPGLSRGHILVAEDDPGLAAAIGQLLSDEYTVQLASDGAEALAAAQRRLPDLLITDIEMPQIDGLELARQLQSLPGETPTPVLVMSARAKLGDRLAGFSAGAVDYVIKPFDPSELRARVRAQLAYRTLALRLQRSEKLAALGTLSAGLAHELRNPANGIVNAIAPLRELLPAEALAPDTGVGELLDVMQQCAEQVAYVSRQLLGFRRSGDLELRRVPIGEVLTRALSNASAALAEVELRTRYAYQGLLRCAAPLLTQVLVNLIENAAQAAGPGGWVELATRGDDQVVAIELTDSGPGVPEHLTERVFEPFFTTKPPGQGTGLGLATARDLILRHGGTLELRSRSGRTVFVIELPQAPEVRP
ncbi:MAG: response regulator [Kofleriaceae bacterium]|nr:response regulator [Kofleriaceae bacterium]MBP9170367.1 response regulator [Kofleriaceae bacterium]MBP9860071.1 response regulator [Kofleriaceae bacterium]